jgi:hypothetical protein
MDKEFACTNCPFGLVRFTTSDRAYCTTREDAAKIKRKIGLGKASYTKETPVVKCVNPSGDVS